MTPSRARIFDAPALRRGLIAIGLVAVLAATPSCEGGGEARALDAGLVPTGIERLPGSGLPEPTEQVIEQVVRRRFLQDATPGLEALRIWVNDGVVELSGVVPTLAARERAIEIVSSVEGARALVNRVAVLSPPVSDVELAAEIGTRLASEPAIDPGDIAAVVDDGAVTLVGGVESRVERDTAVAVTRRTPGVRSLESRVVVRRPLARTDEDIRADVAAALTADVYTRPADVTADVSEGVVHLSGAVGTPTEKDRLITLAAVEGVRRVDASDLRVDWTSEPMSRAHPEPPTDEELAAAVEHALDESPRVPDAFLFVEVEDGVATLNGDVIHADQRDAATRAALTVEGIRWVVNDLDVVEDRQATR